MERHVTG